MNKRVLWTVGLILAMLLAVAALVSVTTAPPTSGVAVLPCLSGVDGCLRFPAITGAALSGQEIMLPAEFDGRFVLVIVPFDRDQQVTANTWLPLARDLAQQNPGLSFYSIAVFPDMAAPMRAFIRAGMNLLIPADIHTITLTTFLQDRQAFLDALAIPDVGAIQVFLLNADGEVLWRGQGEFTPEQGHALQIFLQPV